MPVGTPAAVVARIQGELAKQVSDPDVAKRFSGKGLSVHASAPREFGKHLSAEVARWQQVVKAAGIQK
ncbi:MAG: hypothetical protein ACO3IW_11240 [Burkholderiales bacterium]